MVHEISKFRINGLFKEYDHVIDFKHSNDFTNIEARICLILGGNGIGKTTMLNMIEGMLELDFNPFRNVPFKNASLELSCGSSLDVTLFADQNVLEIKFNDAVCHLNASEPGPSTDTPDTVVGVESLRANALPILSKVSFEKLDIHRSIALREKDTSIHEEHFRQRNGKLSPKHRGASSLLSGKVKRFVREAQVDYKKYFISEGPELFPKIIKRLANLNANTVTVSELIHRLGQIKASEVDMARFGLSINMSDIDQLTNLLEDENDLGQNSAGIAALEAYVETLESKHAERCLIHKRLTNFENLIGNFFTNKRVEIDHEKGLTIYTQNDDEIDELMLSSGEYHLLYMMVTALVSTRTGTAIAIDEPELSLHITWQRKLVNALISCSSGASPLFVFATHSSAIAAEYEDKWTMLK
ncbi:ATP-binding protein [Vibrio chagasii]|nr:ATP-binding protein [Vibrio chagasii]